MVAAPSLIESLFPQKPMFSSFISYYGQKSSTFRQQSCCNPCNRIFPTESISSFRPKVHETPTPSAAISGISPTTSPQPEFRALRVPELDDAGQWTRMFVGFEFWRPCSVHRFWNFCVSGGQKAELLPFRVFTQQQRIHRPRNESLLLVTWCCTSFPNFRVTIVDRVT